MMKYKYFRARDGSFYKKHTKEEIYSKINNADPNTFLPYLKELNYPYIEEEWKRTAEYRSEYCFGRYLAKMRLAGFRHCVYADSENLNLLRRKEEVKLDIN